ncbi:uncharacterized protein [Populus alba]|uniref:uncharacterized protein isoform X3 n=1 Tax=Populus alba TaxID=43335 RepID=UPI003CC74C1E
MSFITLNHGVSFIFGWTGYPSVDKQGMPFVNIKEGKKTRVIITSQISSSRYPYFRDKVFEQQKMLFVKEHRELREEQRTMVNLGSVLYMQVDVFVRGFGSYSNCQQINRYQSVFFNI